MSLFHSVKIGQLVLSGNLFLAPVAGYTDRAFRSICAEYGADFSFTELVSAEALCRKPYLYALGSAALMAGSANASASTAASSPPTVSQPVAAAVNLIKRGDNEKHYAIQLFGAEPETIYRAAMLLAPLKPDAIDINAGCPVPKVVKSGAGSALMKNPSALGRIVEAAVKASAEGLGNVPVTVKIRSGWDSGSINYAKCARVAVLAGAAMVTLHPRTRGQGYGGKSDWSCITDLVSRISVPVAGSGDLYSPQDAMRMLSETGCAAVMFARGAMGNPFIFSAARSLLIGGREKQVSFSERIAVALRHLELLAADIGERPACLEMRKQFCAYTKLHDGAGMQGGAQLRNELVRACTIADYREITGKYMEPGQN